MGLFESAAEFFPEAAWQCCIVHWYRNVFSHVPSTKVREVAAMLKAIRAGEDLVAARQQAVRVIEKLRGLRLTTAAELVESAVEETLAYYAFPEEHWRRIGAIRGHRTGQQDPPAPSGRAARGAQLWGIP
jgi:transposase-like protein